MSHGIYGRGFWPSKAATERIISATSIDFPAGQDTAELREDLYECVMRVFNKQVSKPGYHARYKRQARNIVEHVDELKRLIGPYVNGLFYQQLRDKLDPGDYDAA